MIAQNVHALLDALYTLGKLPEGGVYRPVYSEPWQLAHRQVAEWMAQCGLRVRADAVGNLIGRIDGSEDGPVVATGSHIDTVRGGGRLDGALGVVGGLMALSTLRTQHGQPRRPLELIVTCEEEGSRFTNNFWGSLSIVGEADEKQANQHHDVDGVTIAQAMRQIQLDPARIAQAVRSDIGWFLEMHIEQGAVLEQKQLDVGIVTAITGLTHFRVTVTGRADHAGTTPMQIRNDALTGAAAMILAIEHAARALGAPAVATVGRISVEPGQANVVPSSVIFSIDARHPDRSQQLQLCADIRAELQRIADERALGIHIEQLTEHPPVPMAPEIIDAVQAAAEELGVSHQQMASGAGHDAQIMARRCKAGMLFVPSMGGRSHTPAEDTAPAALERGIQVLTGALYRLAY